MRSIIAILLVALLPASSLVAQPTPGRGASTAPTPTTSYHRLYVFGDSYSDFGAGYIDCDGPTAVAYLGWHMGLNITHAKAPNAAEKSLVFAVSGARTGEGNGKNTKDAFLAYGMMNQTRDFVTRVKSGEIHFDPETTLFFIAGGLNDRSLPLETTTENLRKEIEMLKDLGGKHFTVALLPVKIRQFTSAGTRLNPALPQLAENIHKDMGVDIWLNHWGAYYDDVMDHPANYGIVNTTSPCAGRAIFDQDPTPLGDPATYFFYHEGHPSTAVHRIVGKKLYEELAAKATHAP
ncbi:MAG TPA: SGNH/GDSL hydrolase family protein [Tepidisphaeraceae bacterium]|nr:SGNH/GDSL hydrolase family protein [Tepidisphaeraceae bacterium]